MGLPILGTDAIASLGWLDLTAFILLFGAPDWGGPTGPDPGVLQPGTPGLLGA